MVAETGAGFQLTTLMVIRTDCIGSYKSNYLTNKTTTGLGIYNERNLNIRSHYTSYCLIKMVNETILPV